MDFGDWLGSVWFSFLAFAVGWVLGQVWPLARLTKRR